MLPEEKLTSTVRTHISWKWRNGKLCVNSNQRKQGWLLLEYMAYWVYLQRPGIGLLDGNPEAGTLKSLYSVCMKAFYSHNRHFFLIGWMLVWYNWQQLVVWDRIHFRHSGKQYESSLKLNCTSIWSSNPSLGYTIGN